MDILKASRQIIAMYNMEESPDAEAWKNIFKRFENALKDCSDVDTLVECLMEDDCWCIPFDYRIQLMEKAKALDADSYDFLIDYYGFKSAFLDPGDEHIEAYKKLIELQEAYKSLVKRN